MILRALKGPLRERKDSQEFPDPDTSLWEPLGMGVCFGLVLVWVRLGDRARTEPHAAGLSRGLPGSEVNSQSLFCTAFEDGCYICPFPNCKGCVCTSEAL